MIDFDKKFEEIENRILHLGRKIADYENKLGDYLSLEQLLKNFVKKYDEEKSHFERNNFETFHRLQSFFKWLENTEKNIESQKKESELLFECVQKDLKSLKDFHVHHYDLAARHTFLEKRVESLDSKQEVHSLGMAHISEKMVLKDKQIEELKEKCFSLCNEKNVLESRLKSVEEKSQEHSDLLFASEVDYDQIVSTFSSEVVGVHSRLTQFESSIKKYIDEKIASLQIPKTDHLIEKKELDDLRHQIALSTLDAKNAVSKSNMAEMQLQLAAKKLDALQLHLKALEVPK